MKKLYWIDITMMVMAEDEDEAAEIAARKATPENCVGRLALSVPSEWRDAIPFGADDDLTCGEILKRQREAV